MKTIFKISAVLALMFVTTTSMANDPKISLAPESGTKSVIVELDEQAKASILRLTDADNNPIFFENVNEDRYAKKFNLKDLVTGTYYFTIENALSSVTYTLNVNNDDVKIKSKLVNITKSIFRTVGDKVYVNLLNTDQQKVNIEIVDGRNRVVFKESIKGELTLGKAFNFKKAVEGSYTIMIYDGERLYSKNIIIG
jgi:phage tail tube protein FII